MIHHVSVGNGADARLHVEDGAAAEGSIEIDAYGVPPRDQVIRPPEPTVHAVNREAVSAPGGRS